MRNPVVDADLERIIGSGLNWTPLAGATVLVSGASGFLPAYMVETLLALNERNIQRPTNVVGLVRNIAKARTRFSHYEGRSDLALVEADVCQPTSNFETIDYIVHAASQASPKLYSTDPVGTSNPALFQFGRRLRAQPSRDSHGRGSLRSA